MRILWTEKEPAYNGELVSFPPVRCEPKPVQKAGVPVLLGARGPKALERVVRSYDGWCPVVGKPESFKRDIAALRRLAAERGRNPDQLRITGFVAPGEDGISLDNLRFFKDAGAHHLIMFSQKDAIKMAAGKTMEIVRRLAPTVERAVHA
jgi:hypothetical protein